MTMRLLCYTVCALAWIASGCSKSSDTPATASISAGAEAGTTTRSATEPAPNSAPTLSNESATKPATNAADSSSDLPNQLAASRFDTAENAAEPSPLKSSGTQRVRVATYNVSMFRDQHGKLAADLADGNDTNAHRVAHVIQSIRPDILLLNEFDYDENQTSLRTFLDQYLQVGHEDADPLSYDWIYTNSVNTGVPSRIDLDNDGRSDGWNDCYGFGKHPGQYGMAVLSRFPIDTTATRTFQHFTWKSMPGALLPIVPGTQNNFYSDEALQILRLSSKSHWDVCIDLPGGPLHFLVCHPTPPVFDGPEDRNGKRNHDEIRLFADYVSPERSDYLVDDHGRAGGLAAGSHFVIAGDLNADPNDGDSHQQAVRQLTEHPLIHATPVPSSKGPVEVAGDRANANHKGNPAHDTADFDDRRTGNLRVDYVLPSKTMKVVDAGVFWPERNDPAHDLIKGSDHRLVWIDVEIGP